MRGPVPSRTRSHHTAWRRCTCHCSQEPSQLPRDLQVPHSHHLSLAQLLGVRHRVRKQACCSPTCRPPFLSPAATRTPHPPPAPVAAPRPPRASALPSAAGEQTVRVGSGGQRRRPQAHLTDGGQRRGQRNGVWEKTARETQAEGTE